MTDLFAESRILIDRSDLERCASCPMSMRLLQSRKRVVGTAANIGQEVHDAISKTIASYIGAEGFISRSDLADDLMRNLAFTRPDVQPFAIETARASVYAIGRTINETDPDAILRFDGGEGERSGQIAWDFNEDVRLTLELDLLRATSSQEVLRIDDWKTGWGTLDIDDVRDSFQFQMQAALVLKNYEAVQRVDVVIWNTRHGHALPPVHFYRSKLEQYLSRLTTAVNAWVDNAEPVPLTDVVAWPSTEKCRLCDASIECPAAERELSADPVGLLKQRIALTARLDAIDKLLQAAVTRQGYPIRTDAGDCYGKFGTEKPRETWKLKAGKGGEE